MNTPKPDTMVRALNTTGELRATFLRTTALYNTIMDRHAMDPIVAAATGRVATAALLLASVMKGKQVVTVEIQGGEGPLKMIRATAATDGTVRAYANIDVVPDGITSVAEAIGGGGFMRVLKDLGMGMPYEGVVPLAIGDVCSDLSFYYLNSDQIKTAVALDEIVEGGRFVSTGGYMVQVMPPMDDTVQAELRHITLSERLAEDVDALGPLADLLRGDGDAEQLFGAIFDDHKVLETIDIGFACPCSAERMSRGLRMLGREELMEALEEQGEPLLITCHFCSTDYPFTKADVDGLFS